MRSKVLLAIFFMLSIIGTAYGGEDRVTPYGDYCKDCTIYGVCKDLIPLNESVSALDNYYRPKGYRVGFIKHSGRFIVAEIYKGMRPVDTVLFDRKTGRLRSIY